MRENFQLLVVVGIALLLILIAAEETRRTVSEPTLIKVVREKIESGASVIDTVETEEGLEEDEEEELFKKLSIEHYAKLEKLFPHDSAVYLKICRQLLRQFFVPPD
ncbi:MAG: hypothetical protein ACUVUD_05890 [bacterium]